MSWILLIYTFTPTGTTLSALPMPSHAACVQAMQARQASHRTHEPLVCVQDSRSNT